MDTGISFSEINRPGREPEHQPLSKAEVKNYSHYTSTHVMKANSFITGTGTSLALLYFMVSFIKFTRCGKKYGECLNKKIITVKYTLPLIPIKYPPPLRTHLSHCSCHFLKRFWKSSFVSVFSCLVVVASKS